jgi:RNA polymerase sigma-70 factor (ECF subfamily)
MAMLAKDTEVKLIARARKGDGDAMEQLIRAHQDALYAFILRMAGRPDVAEDVVQEAFVRVLANLDRFDDRYRFSTWLFTIARRLFVNAMQKLKPTYDTDTVGGQAGHGHEPGFESAEMETMDNARRVIDDALADLNPQQREIILLFHQQNWPIQQIAEHLGMPEGTVKSHLHRARRRMRRCIIARADQYEQVQEVWT